MDIISSDLGKKGRSFRKSVWAKKRFLDLSEFVKAKRIRLAKEAFEAGDIATSKEIESTPLNFFLLEIYKKDTGQSEFKTFEEWQAEGFQVVAGSESFRIWDAPKSIEKNDGSKEKVWPMVALFHSGQVKYVGQESA